MSSCSDLLAFAAEEGLNTYAKSLEAKYLADFKTQVEYPPFTSSVRDPVQGNLI